MVEVTQGIDAAGFKVYRGGGRSAHDLKALAAALGVDEAQLAIVDALEYFEAERRRIRRGTVRNRDAIWRQMSF